MTAEQLDACLDRLRWTKADLARELACDHQVVRRWLAGARIPDSVAAWLGALIKAHDRLPAPQDWRKRGAIRNEIGVDLS